MRPSTNRRPLNWRGGGSPPGRTACAPPQNACSSQKGSHHPCLFFDRRYVLFMNQNPDPGHPNRKHPAHHPPLEQHNKPIIIFLTVCAHQRRKILAAEHVQVALIDIWMSSRQWMVGRYVVMPDHIHLFCWPIGKEAESVAQWTTYWKRAVSRALPDLQPIWQRDCWDTQLRRHENYTEKWHYVRNNPVRAGLVETADEWPFQGELNHLPW